MNQDSTDRRTLSPELLADLSLEQALVDAEAARARLADALDRSTTLEADALRLRAEVGNLQLLLSQERHDLAALRASRSYRLARALSRVVAPFAR
ncbi:hypothetical protein H9657_18290 [Cellulomonas sp. Sa3CUA2]|uniref:Uncharacterized protein n=1 Tax=Cellulomonas avistercoris TaxID=2762242 RepID=A0ABR8QIG3_9CELL|nr:hypothetical protein [Cellulomonas avistercoris]MBD7920226.1 hypothetical protein [Cellulomonas avistercoris]